MSNVQQAGVRAAVLKVLAELVKGAYEEARAEADGELADLNGSLGVATVELKLPTGDTIAQLTQSQSKQKVDVDERQLLAYCKREYPTEVEAVESVRPAFRKALLGRLEVVDGKAVDPRTGVVLEFVTVTPPGPGGTTLTFKTAGRDRVAAAYREGVLTLPDLLALPAAEH
jgi:hypothetical protein